MKTYIKDNKAIASSLEQQGEQGKRTVARLSATG